MQEGETAIERFACEYTSQIAYYTEKIAAMPEWTMVRLYADEGISGTSMKRRKEFLKMLRVTG